MKKLVHCGRWPALLLASALAVACVDRDYDLNNIDGGWNTIGDQFVAPLGKITSGADEILSIDQLLEELGLSGKITPEELEQIPLPVPERFEATFGLEVGLSSDLVDMLTSQGELRLMVAIENSIPMGMTVGCAFYDAAGGMLCRPIEDKRVEAGTKTAPSWVEYEIGIEEKDLRGLAESSQMRIDFVRADSEPVHLRGDETFVLRMRIAKTGGIQF